MKMGPQWTDVVRASRPLWHGHPARARERDAPATAGGTPAPRFSEQGWVAAVCREGKMNFRRKVLLATCGLAVVALPFAFALAYTAPNGPASQSEATAATGPRFEVASIKLYASDPAGWRLGHSIADPPNEGTFEATEVTVEGLVEMAFGVHDSWLIQGGPNWFRSEKFDIQAKAGSAANQELSGLSGNQGAALKHRMLQALLADRFKLAVHRETKDLPGYALVIAQNGPKLREAKSAEAKPGTTPGPGERSSMGIELGQFSFQRMPIAALAEYLSDRLGCVVLDRTGLKGNYSFTLQWKPADNPHMFDASDPSLFALIQEQLGLKLEPAKNPVEVLVIDHIEKPSLN